MNSCCSGLKITMVVVWPIFAQQGGAERILCELSNELIRKGHSVTVLSADKTQGKPFYPTDPMVRFEHYGDISLPLMQRKLFLKLRSWRIRSASRRNIRSILGWESELEKFGRKITECEADVYMAFSASGAYLIRSALGKEVPVVTMFHSTPKFECYDSVISNYVAGDVCDNFVQGWLDNFLAIVGSSNVVQVLMPEFVDDTKMMLNANVVCIPNPVSQYLNASDLKGHKIICVARFAPVKRQHLVVEAFSLLARKYPDRIVEFWGRTDDPYSERVRELIDEYGLRDRVRVCGVSKNIEKEMEGASILVMASEFEGFCLGLVEAMSKGLPVVGCNTCAALNTIIRNGENGFLCDDTPEAIASALSRLMESDDLRKRLGARGREDAKVFAPDLIWKKWEDILSSVVK